jgi:hypothetical protein
MSRLALFVFLLLLPRWTLAQIPSSNPQALTVAAQSIAAMIGTTAVTDITMSGSATRNAGSETETGTIAFKALSTGASRFDLNWDNGSLSEVILPLLTTTAGEWIDSNGSLHPFALHNMRTDSVWFFPPFGALNPGPKTALSYIGLETRNGASVHHLHSSINDGTTLTPQLSGMDFYIDAKSFLPVAVTFSTHPDKDPTVNIPVEIDFSAYQTFEGINVPSHIQKYFAGQLMLDSTITSVSINSGLSSSAFPVR